jgi:predicted nucleic acid-binding protein
LWETDHFASSSILCYPEGHAALAAARRGRRLTSDQYRTAAGDFDSLLGELHLLGVDLALTRHAGRLAVDGLRGYDAVHLASALAIGADAVVTWDNNLGRGAQRSGLGVAPADEPG